MIREGIARIVLGEDLRETEMMAVMTEVMEGEATPAQIAAFMTALRIKGETVEEVTGAARIMRQKATRIDARSTVVVDTCGTGGDGRNTFNISTTAAFVVAAAGLTVAKHFETRLELRGDFANKDLFVKGDVARKNQFTGLVAFLAYF